MKSYYRVMLGQKSRYISECLAGNFIGTDFELDDLINHLPDDGRSFNQEFIPVYQKIHPGKSKVAAGLACGSLWTVSKGIKQGDIVLCPDGTGQYRIGEVIGDYYFASGEILQHRRPVVWRETPISKASLSEALKNSAGSMGTVSNLTAYTDEIESLLEPIPQTHMTVNDPTVEDPLVFALEKHLEDFLVANWKNTDLGKDYDIYEENGDVAGRQYPLAGMGSIDILAVRKDKKELLIVELKRGRASDVVVGQILRYMGYVSQELAESDQNVRGIIIAQDNDLKLKMALVMTPSVSFYRYQVFFKLEKV